MSADVWRAQRLCRVLLEAVKRTARFSPLIWLLCATPIAIVGPRTLSGIVIATRVWLEVAIPCYFLIALVASFFDIKTGAPPEH